jgi:tyrosine-protein kinase Etk/Wzc
MSDDNLLQIDPQKRRQPQEDMIDLKKILFLFIRNWYYFITALFVALVCALLYNSYAIPTYKVSATLLIKTSITRL